MVLHKSSAVVVCPDRSMPSRARDTPVAARTTKTERQPPDIMAGPSSSMHPPPTLARRPTGKAVLALEVRSRTLHGHAPWTPSGALTANLHVLTCDKLCPERPCGCRALVYECLHLSRPIGAARIRRGRSGEKSELSPANQGCNKPA